MTATSSASSAALRPSAGHTRAFTEPGRVVANPAKPSSSILPSFSTAVKLAAFGAGCYFKLPTLTLTSTYLLTRTFMEGNIPARVEKYSKGISELHKELLANGIQDLATYERLVAKFAPLHAEGKKLASLARGDDKFEKALVLNVFIQKLLQNFHRNFVQASLDPAVKEFRVSLATLHDDSLSQGVRDNRDLRITAAAGQVNHLKARNDATLLKLMDDWDTLKAKATPSEVRECDRVLTLLRKVQTEPDQNSVKADSQNIVYLIRKFCMTVDNPLRINANFEAQNDGFVSRYNELRDALLSCNAAECPEFLEGVRLLNNVFTSGKISMRGDQRLISFNERFNQNAPAAPAKPLLTVRGLFDTTLLGLTCYLDHKGYTAPAVDKLRPYTAPLADKLKTLLCTYLGPQLARFGICPQ